MTRAELIRALARVEDLQRRNQAQRKGLGDGMHAMADHASRAVEELRPAVAAGDPEATQLAKRGLYGRMLARRLADA